MQAPEQYMLYTHHLYISSYHWLRAVMHTFSIWFIWKRPKIKEKRDSVEHSRQGRENRKKRGKAKGKRSEEHQKKKQTWWSWPGGEPVKQLSHTQIHTHAYTQSLCVTHMSERRANPCWRLITQCHSQREFGDFFPLLSHLTDTHLCLRDARLGRCSTTYNPAYTFHAHHVFLSINVKRWKQQAQPCCFSLVFFELQLMWSPWIKLVFYSVRRESGQTIDVF